VQQIQVFYQVFFIFIGTVHFEEREQDNFLFNAKVIKVFKLFVVIKCSSCKMNMGVEITLSY